MQYRLEQLEEIQVVGFHRSYRSGTQAQKHIASFWEDVISAHIDEELARRSDGTLNGLLGVCISHEDGRMDYLIGVTNQSIPHEGYSKVQLVKGDYLVVTTSGPFPDSIQRTMRHIHVNLLPREGFRIKDANFFELYLPGDIESDDYVAEIWLPIESE
ncbi:GyrI-like domain-containing protein [Staphylococcus lugdunensis]|uniref:GyrI-like domain-containing protein n=1 Tax=Staphylococcus lugdunensis TaxID=28035 RepID=UPI001F4C979E|nr:GyrI-like domain-containing protein [Staphylococcus lugdunensis]MCH8646493.1 GyrI-like domain-containing protein [Staphylococcus lugdunensis]